MDQVLLQLQVQTVSVPDQAAAQEVQVPDHQAAAQDHHQVLVPVQEVQVPDQAVAQDHQVQIPVQILNYPTPMQKVLQAVQLLKKDATLEADITLEDTGTLQSMMLTEMQWMALQLMMQQEIRKEDKDYF